MCEPRQRAADEADEPEPLDDITDVDMDEAAHDADRDAAPEEDEA